MAKQTYRCGACFGTGRNKRGGPCKPCRGTGRLNNRTVAAGQAIGGVEGRQIARAIVLLVILAVVALQLVH